MFHGAFIQLLAQGMGEAERARLLGQGIGLIIGLAIGVVVFTIIVKKMLKKAKKKEGCPCPKCGQTVQKPIVYTWWGGALGPKLLHHVKCVECGTQFNSQTGKSNTHGIVIYLVVSFVIALIITCLMIYWLINHFKK